MKHNRYPVRTKLVAGTIAAAGMLGIAGCGPDGSKAAQAPASTSQAPTPSTEAAPATPTVSEALKQADVRLQAAAAHAASEILQDIANPATHSAGYLGDHIGNKAYDVAHPARTHTTAPEMFVAYDKSRHMIAMHDINSPNPTAKLEDEAFNQVALGFDVAPEYTALDDKLNLGQQLTVADFQNALASDSNARLEQISTQHGSPASVTQVVRLENGTYDYTFSEPNKGAGPFIVDDANVIKLDQLANDVVATADYLHQQVG